jgi:hypothetical protein
MTDVTEPGEVDSGALRLPKYKPGDDPTWDKLGDGWQAIDGIVKDARIYVSWGTDEDGRSELTGILIEAPITGELLRAIPIGRLSRMPEAEPFDVTELEKLRRRPGEKPAEFAKRVAWQYKIFTQITPHPAKRMAEHSNVPVATVRRWIYDARLLGALPPGTPGRAG